MPDARWQPDSYWHIVAAPEPQTIAWALAVVEHAHIVAMREAPSGQFEWWLVGIPA